MNARIVMVAGVVIVVAVAVVVGIHFSGQKKPAEGVPMAQGPLEPGQPQSGNALPAPEAGVPARPEFEQKRAADGSTRVYRTLLPAEPGAEWSDVQVSVTKKGKRPYLGDYHPSQPVALTVPGLPAHKLLRVTFDLFLFRSWDGSSPFYGFARWDVDTNDNRPLIHTSFANCGFFSDNSEQAFPDEYPSRPHPAWTLATEHETLGYMQSWGGPDRTWDTSSVYHMVLTFPHTESTAEFHFLSTMKGKDKKKVYGLTNFEVATLPELRSFSEGELGEMWKKLGSAEPAEYWDGRWALVSGGDGVVDFIGKHLGDNIDMTKDEAKALAATLTEVNEEKASAVEKKFKQQGKNAPALVLAALGQKNPPIGKAGWDQLTAMEERVGNYAERFPETATELRNRRAKTVLETIHSPAAMKVAAGIADTAPPVGK